MNNTSYFTKETCNSGSIGNLGNQYRYLEKLANVYAEMIKRELKQAFAETILSKEFWSLTSKRAFY